MALDYSKPINKYRQQARQAKQRGIEWLFTFEEWMAVWLESGKWHLRGKTRDSYVMGRKGDTGPYSRENVEIIPFPKNIRDGIRNSFKHRMRGRGWTYIKRGRRRYQVMYSKNYIGSFATQEEAEAAYRAAVEEADKKFSSRRL